MSYSRRQLEAFGEPLGECVTRKEGGRITYGGGGSSSPPATQTQVSDLPDWAKPYAKETLGKGQALTDINKNPYQTYGGERIAGFSPMQQQSFQGAAEMQPSGLGAQAGQMAGAATMGALGTTYDPYRMGQFTSGRAAQYMNPFIEQAMEPQLREAQRTSEMQRVADMGQATRAGAFGGGRQAILEAERQRNLGTQLGDIRARGLMTAFDQAQQNFAREQQLREQSRQYGAGLGIQGLQTAITGAGQMGALGGQQFQQGMDVNKLQNLYGTQQQQLEQQRLGQNYQDFLNQQRYPYQQLEFMSNLLRGTPMGTIQTLYGGQPTLGQQVGALGMGAYGLSKAFAEGGSVTGETFVADAINKLSDAQLAAEIQEATQEAAQGQDQGRLQLLQAEATRRSEARGGQMAGLSSLFSEQMADRVLPTEESMARGGIVAFAGDDEEGQLVRSTSFTPGSPADYAYFLGKGRETFDEMGRAPTHTAMTPAEQMKYRADYIRQLQEGAGESPYKKRLEGITTERDTLGKNLEKAKGLSALRAASAMLQGVGLAQGLGRAGGAFVDSYEKAEAANRVENRALRDMEFNLLDAQRKERMGLNKEATAALREVDRDRALAVKARNDRLAAQGNLARGMAAAAKPQRPTGAGGAKQAKINEQLAAAEIAYERDPSEANLKNVTALRRAVSQVRTSDVGPTRAAIDTFRTTSTTDTEVEKRVRESKFSDAAWMAAYEKNDAKGMAAAEDAIAERIRGRATAQPPAAAASATAPRRPASAPVNTNSTRAANPAKVEGLPPGSVVRGNEVYDAAGKLIGHVR
jgi:hypothetical protein